jgi:predicted nuclease of predicted toxin-antitoxin system
VSDVRYYTDEHIARAVAAGLRLRGIDVVTVPEAGMLGASDEEHLALALFEGRVVVTQDADFLRLAEQGHPHAGIVYAAQQTPIGTIMRGLLLIQNVLSAEDMVGNIEFL